MADLTARFETGTHGNTIVTGDTGDSTAWSGTDGPGTTGTRQYDNTYAAAGSLSAKIGCTATDANINLYWATALGTDTYGRLYLLATANPGGNVTIHQVRNTTFTHQWGLRLRSDGKVAMIDVSFVEQAVTANAMQLNRWMRLEWHVTQAGLMEMYVYPSDSTLAIESVSVTGKSTGTDWARCNFGANYAGTFTFWLDNLLANATSYPGPQTVWSPETDSTRKLRVVHGTGRW